MKEIQTEVVTWLQQKKVAPDIQEMIVKYYKGIGFPCMFSGQPLTGVQVLITALMAMGLTTKRVGFIMGTSHATVEKHLDVVHKRLRVSNRVELTHHAIVNGVIKPGQYIVD